MYLYEAVEKHPQLKELLEDEFDDETWDVHLKEGEAAHYKEGIDRVFVSLEADMSKPITFEKRFVESELASGDSYFYVIKNK